jgi:hypothetical protein
MIELSHQAEDSHPCIRFCIELGCKNIVVRQYPTERRKCAECEAQANNGLHKGESNVSEANDSNNVRRAMRFGITGYGQDSRGMVLPEIADGASEGKGESEIPSRDALPWMHPESIQPFQDVGIRMDGGKRTTESLSSQPVLPPRREGTGVSLAPASVPEVLFDVQHNAAKFAEQCIELKALIDEQILVQEAYCASVRAKSTSPASQQRDSGSSSACLVKGERA